ncbi:MAG: hypothetical protein ABSA27_04395 [Terriglobales bacterium]|jgi:hypothetical protein
MPPDGEWAVSSAPFYTCLTPQDSVTCITRPSDSQQPCSRDFDADLRSFKQAPNLSITKRQSSFAPTIATGVVVCGGVLRACDQGVLRVGEEWLTHDGKTGAELALGLSPLTITTAGRARAVSCTNSVR